jgi:hypothetical protein
MHNNRKTTDRYTMGGVSERLRLAVSEFDRMPAGSKTAGSDEGQSTSDTAPTAAVLAGSDGWQSDKRPNSTA